MTALSHPAGDSGVSGGYGDNSDSDACAHLHADSYADIVEKLFGEFEGRLSLCAIVDVVNSCRHDLAGSPIGALPELTERLARHRIADLIGG